MKSCIGVIGGGLIGRAWAIVFARAGCLVQLWDPDHQVRNGMMDELAKLCRTSGEDISVLDRIRVTEDLASALEGVQWVQENGPEDLAIKRSLFAELDRLTGDDVILATSSSALTASGFAEGLPGRGRMMVAHPVNPPHLIPVVELCPGPDTAPEVMDCAEVLMRAVSQVPVRLNREIDGFVLNRLQAVLLAEALSLIEQGVVSPQGLDDTICHGLGRRWALLGPMAAINLNAAGGVRDYLARFGPTMARLSNSAAQGDAFTDSVADLLAAALPAPEQVPELSLRRDARLADLARFLACYNMNKGEVPQ